ncbi:hypothetical protein HPB50_019265 [Hyalomma asiaticum]|uniref:Uncharacterized protein n=1 Tax=Hyalomma asiaticum TaxID=266040 RepID=A0ACB7T5V1_HYAAI|nr:hypothetical protein HPB50_019265 [Hyalomma asiaticum]
MAAGPSEFRDLRRISALCCVVFAVVCLDCGVRCAAGGDAKPSIKLFGNIGKFANRSGVHEFLKSNLFLASLAKESSASSLAAAAESATSDRQDAIADSIYLQVEARSLGSHLRKISNEELGVTAMQGIYDELPFTTDNFDAAKQLDEDSPTSPRPLLRTFAVTGFLAGHHFVCVGGGRYSTSQPERWRRMLDAGCVGCGVCPSLVDVLDAFFFVLPWGRCGPHSWEKYISASCARGREAASELSFLFLLLVLSLLLLRPSLPGGKELSVLTASVLEKAPSSARRGGLHPVILGKEGCQRRLLAAASALVVIPHLPHPPAGVS